MVVTYAAASVVSFNFPDPTTKANINYMNALGESGYGTLIEVGDKATSVGDALNEFFDISPDIPR